MRVSDRVIGFTALAVSLLLHGLLFFESGSVAGNKEPKEPEPTVTRVSFHSVAAPKTPPQQTKSIPDKIQESEVQETPKPPPEPDPPKQEKRAKRAKQPEPVPAVQSEPTAPTSAPTTAEAEKPQAAAEAVAGSVEDPALIEKAKQEYLRRLMAHIEAHKEYPRAARRRRIEGDVRVAFSLQKDGGVTSLQAEGGHSLLTGAARRAVEYAVPMPQPPESLPMPWPVVFTMRFSLN